MFKWRIFRKRGPRVGLFLADVTMHRETMLAFHQGLVRHGVDCFVAPLDKGWKPCEVSITFGIRKSVLERGRLVGEVIKRQSENGGRHLVLERGFLRRDRYFMAGWGGLNGRADFCNEQMPSDRFDALQIPVRPWRENGQHIILCGQVPWDSAVEHVDFPQWCRTTALRLRELTDRPVIFRPHPEKPEAIDMQGTGVVYSTRRTILEDLEDAWCVVTFNSNSGVEAAIEGVPVFTADEGSMARAISRRRLEEVEQPLLSDRSQWLADLAYTQWTHEEFAAGLTWEHLKRRLDEAPANKPLAKAG